MKLGLLLSHKSDRNRKRRSLVMEGDVEAPGR
jgi:hypothetical protein